MGGERQEIDAKRGDVDRDAPKRLRGVAEESAAVPLHDAGGFGDRVDYTRLVVGEHQRYGGHASAPIMARERSLKRGKVDCPGPRDRKPAHASRREPSASEHAWMLGRADVEMASPRLTAPGLEARRQRQRGGLRGAAGEDDVLRLCADRCRDLGARLLDHSACFTALRVHRRRVRAVVERAEHSRPRRLQERRAGICVEIDGA